jgi:predicted nucleotidyltransferase
MANNKKIIEEVRKVLVNEFSENEIVEVVLFGSQANGVSNISSDYDYLN